MATATSESVTEVSWVDPTTVKVSEEQNPRKTMDPEKYMELREDIKEKGIFTPLLVRRVGEEFHLIAGYRRHAIAVELKHTEVPVAVVTEGTDDFRLAVSENLQREGFTLADESRIVARLLGEKGTTHKKVAKQLHKSEQWVSARAVIGKLSEDALAIVSKGILPAGHLELVGRALASHPQLVEQLLRVVQYQVEANQEDIPQMDEWRRTWPQWLEDVTNPEAGGNPELFLLKVYANWYSRHRMQHLSLNDEDADAVLTQAGLVTDWKLAGDDVFTFSDVDLGAAREFGALLEIEVPSYGGTVRTERYITDKQWFIEFVKSRKAGVDKLVKKQAKLDAERGATPTAANKAAAGGDAVEPSKEEKAKTRAREIKQMHKAVGANHALWAQLLANVGKIKVYSKEGVDLLLNHTVRWEQLDAAMVLLDPVNVELPDGKRPKFVLDKDKVHGIAKEWVLKAKKPEEQLQRAIGLMAATCALDTSVIAQARRPHYSFGMVSSAGVRKLVEKVYLPAQLKRIK